MKKVLLVVLLIVSCSSSLYSSSKMGVDFKIGSGYMDTVKTEYVNSKYENNSLSTFVIGAGLEFYDKSSIYVGSDIEIAIVDDAYTNAIGSLTTIFAKIGFHIDKSIIAYGLGGFSYQNLQTETIDTSGSGYVYGAGVKFNHQHNIGVEANIKMSQLVDNFNNEYLVNSITINCVLFF